MFRTKFALGLTGALLMSGCQQYLVRQDFIESYAGDAVARNNAQQMVDPWPRYSYNTNIATNGNRQANAVGKYRNFGEQAAPQLQPLQLVVPSAQ